MLRFLIFVLAFASVYGLAHPQGISILSPHPYMPEGVISYHDGTETITCDSPRPLLQAIDAVSEEYGWDVSYEDPPYQGKHDVIDMTNPKWRETHPDAPYTPGPSGGPFQSTYPEQAYVANSLGQEQQVLEKIVSDYNKSGNPGHFVVRVLADGAFDVVGDGVRDDNGVEAPVAPFWDTPISIALAPRTFDATIGGIERSHRKNGRPNRGHGVVIWTIWRSGRCRGRRSQDGRPGQRTRSRSFHAIDRSNGSL